MRAVVPRKHNPFFDELLQPCRRYSGAYLLVRNEEHIFLGIHRAGQQCADDEAGGKVDLVHHEVVGVAGLDAHRIEHLHREVLQVERHNGL